MQVHYAVTFEFELRAPLTARGTVTASSVAAAMRRAALEAQKTLKPIGWSSVVCVLLDRADTRDPAKSPDAEPGAAREKPANT